MKNRIFSILICLPAVLSLTGCDLSPNTDYQRYVVIEAYLTAEQMLPPVFLSWSVPVEQEYEFQEATIEHADIRVELLNNDGLVTHRFPYEMTSSGIYRPEIYVFHRVQPRRTYRLTAEVPEFGTVSARTTVPDTFRVVSPVPESLEYQRDTLHIEITNTPHRDAQQNVFLFQTTADNPTEANLTPFYEGLVRQGEGTLEDFVNNASTPINEANFRINEQGLIELQFPWIAAAFFGENRIAANSLDRNLVDLLRSQSVQTGGSTLPPGEIPNVIFNIEGGVGVFGSVSVDTIRTRFDRPSAP